MASIWPIAERIPSSICIFSTISSIASTLGKRVTLVTRDPSLVFSKLKRILIVGIASLRRPSSCAKPSSSSGPQNFSSWRGSAYASQRRSTGAG